MAGESLTEKCKRAKPVRPSDSNQTLLPIIDKNGGVMTEDGENEEAEKGDENHGWKVVVGKVEDLARKVAVYR